MEGGGVPYPTWRLVAHVRQRALCLAFFDANLVRKALDGR